ncbi:MAG: hypothetical protein FJY56_21195 [Betaproteobacteria bacterium]|nr:hypothetical protein [Betaproteobacteria bacterium]
MQALETKIPPPLLTAVIALGMWLAFHYEASDNTPVRVRTIASTAALLSSAALALGAFIAFWRAHTTINPFRPARAAVLVTHGVYRHTRNPMYLRKR